MARGKAAVDGETRVSQNGYHYTKKDGKWELTHKLTVEEALGRKLATNERIRFKDGDKTNFEDPDNLIVYVVREKSKNARIAYLESKIEEFQNELDTLRESE